MDEAAATGDVAAPFADIRATLGVGVVNLIWRHLATIDGALRGRPSRFRCALVRCSPALTRSAMRALQRREHLAQMAGARRELAAVERRLAE